MQNLNKNYLADRFKFIREHVFKLSQSEMAVKCDLTQRDISQIESGKKKFLPMSFIQLLNKERINLNSLFDDLADHEKLRTNLTSNLTSNLTPNGLNEVEKAAANIADNGLKTAPKMAPNYAPNDNKTAIIQLTPRVIQVDRNNNELIALVPHKAAAGYLNGYNDPEYIESLPSIVLPGLAGLSHRAFEIKGQSMLPTHHSGSISIGRSVESFKDIRDRRVYIVVSKNEGIVLKRVLNRIKEDGKLILMSDNDNKREYPNDTIDAEDILELWYWRASIIRESPEPGGVYNRINDIESRLTLLQNYVSQLIPPNKGLLNG